MKLPKYLILNKEIGETPLEVLENFKAANHRFAAVPMSYAGRLDPLASGKLFILVGDECKRQKKYIGLDKEYEFEVLLGMNTDTGDVLGMADLGTQRSKSIPQEQDIKQVLQTLSGKRTIAYPPFSSKTVNGQPLFKYALEGTLDTIKIPTKDVEIFSIRHIHTRNISSKDLFFQLSQKIESIKPVTEHSKALGNDFRRPEIRVRYSDLQEKYDQSDFYILKFTCVCSSGTYMRTLAEDIARELGHTGLAYSIHRTKIGKFKTIGPISFWSKLY